MTAAIARAFASTVACSTVAIVFSVVLIRAMIDVLALFDAVSQRYFERHLT